MSSDETPEWVTLGSDEEVVWTGRPSPYLVKYYIGVAVGVGLAAVLALWILPANWQWVGWVTLVAALAVAGYAYVAYRATVYVVTSAKVYRKRGIVRTSVDTVRLDRIQNVSFSQTFLQRLVNCGDMAIDTAGSGGTEILFRSVPHPSRVNGLVIDRLPGDGHERAAV